MFNIEDKDQEELFRILESNNSSDSLEDDFSSSSRFKLKGQPPLNRQKFGVNSVMNSKSE